MPSTRPDPELLAVKGETLKERDLRIHLHLQPLTIQLSARQRYILDLMLQSGLWGNSMIDACQSIIAERLRAELAERERRAARGAP